MSKSRPRRPNRNVEYTFLFKNKKRYTLRFVEEDDNGYLSFYNLTTKHYAKPMTLRHFDWILEHNLIYSKEVNTPLVTTIKYSRQDKMNLRILKALTEEETSVVNSKLAYTVDELDIRYRQALRDKDDDKIRIYRMICESIGHMIKTAN